jgi:hypothetical protein
MVRVCRSVGWRTGSKTRFVWLRAVGERREKRRVRREEREVVGVGMWSVEGERREGRMSILGGILGKVDGGEGW